MRVLILSQYYHPEPVEKVHDLARGLVARGHDVEVLTGFPCYPAGKTYIGYRQRPWRHEELDGVKVTRLPQLPDHSRSAVRRALYYLSFAASAVVLGFFRVRRPDVIYVYLAALPVGCSARLLGLLLRAPYVVDVVDLWPESVAASGMLQRPVAMRMISAAARFVYYGATRINVVTEGFKANLLNQGVDSRKLSTIHSWLPSYQHELVGESRSAFPRSLRPFTVVYAGNIGPAQGLDSVIEAASLLSGEREIEFQFFGDGLDLDHLVELAKSKGLTNVRFMGRRLPHEMPKHYAEADALLVHLKPDALSEVSIPSKTFAYMASGRPILMAVRGCAADFVERQKIGLAVEPCQPVALANAVRRLFEATMDEREMMRKNAIHLYETTYHSSVQIGRMEVVLESGQRRAA